MLNLVLFRVSLLHDARTAQDELFNLHLATQLILFVTHAHGASKAGRRGKNSGLRNFKASVVVCEARYMLSKPMQGKGALGLRDAALSSSVEGRYTVSGRACPNNLRFAWIRRDVALAAVTQGAETKRKPNPAWRFGQGVG